MLNLILCFQVQDKLTQHKNINMYYHIPNIHQEYYQIQLYHFQV